MFDSLSHTATVNQSYAPVCATPTNVQPCSLNNTAALVATTYTARTGNVFFYRDTDAITLRAASEGFTVVASVVLARWTTPTGVQTRTFTPFIEPALFCRVGCAASVCANATDVFRFVPSAWGIGATTTTGEWSFALATEVRRCNSTTTYPLVPATTAFTSGASVRVETPGCTPLTSEITGLEVSVAPRGTGQTNAEYVATIVALSILGVLVLIAAYAGEQVHVQAKEKQRLSAGRKGA